MTWFKVDDKFHSHHKVKGIPRTVRAEAIGTWTLCGTWSADHEKDGYVPEYMVDDLGGSLAGAEALVDVKLWRKRRGGYQFVNWTAYNPTREENDVRRESDRVRKAQKRKAPRSAPDGALSAPDTNGHFADPNPPSRPGPDPLNQDLRDPSSHIDGVGGTDSHSAQGGDKAVDNSHLGRIAARLQMLAPDVVVTPMHAAMASEHVLGKKRGDPPRSPTSYVLGSITRDEHQWQNFVYTQELP